MKNIAVAVDGPSGAGKTTIVKRLASELQFASADTGALYRTVGLYAGRRGLSPDHPEKLIPLLPECHMEIRYCGTEQREILEGEDVSALLRTPEMDRWASVVSAIPEVRTMLLPVQRSLAEKTSILMDGRDIGTVILPDADVKIFLTAGAEERARRRYAQMEEKGLPHGTMEETLQWVLERDERDASRDIAPMRPAEDAYILDTTGMTEEETVQLLLKYIRDKIDAIGSERD